MTSYRRMRRQAGRVHRSGVQLRLAWRYRPELAPAYLAAAIVGASWWLHAARRGHARHHRIRGTHRR